MRLLRHWVRPGLVLAGVTVLVSLPIATPAAQAYSPNPSVRYLSQDAATCDARIRQDASTWSSFPHFDECYIQGTYVADMLTLDPGSENLFIELWHQGDFVGQVLFEAWDEWLWVSDTKNDGDTFYVWINGAGPYYPDGTSEPWDSKEYDLTLDDETVVSIKITDDIAGTDVIASSANGKLPALRP